VADRPYTVLSCGMSLDGYIDSPSVSRLPLSNTADFDRVDGVRASCDAILIGAATLRNDDPRLVVRDPHRQQARRCRGQRATPTKVTVTASADLDARACFFTTGDTDKIVYSTRTAAAALRSRLSEVATVVDAGCRVTMRAVGEDLWSRGVRRLLVEGGGRVHTQFLTDGLVDELQLVVAPLFVGDARAARFVNDGSFPWNPDRRATLADVRRIDDVVLLRYALSDRFELQADGAGPPPPRR
jgi:5-amino-6-(5-phosphoribosylamino)uracil reductase